MARRSSRHSSQHRGRPQDIPQKAKRVLGVILIAFLCIFIRVWHLTVIQHEQRLEASRKPRQRQVFEQAERGTIRDRFHLPLAVNQVQYNIGVCYADIREVPRVIWRIDDKGKRKKVYRRKEYIQELSLRLAEELDLDPHRIEDLIHSKAALYSHLPYPIKQDVGERDYYRLQMLSREWPGIVAERVPKRFYPRGKIAGDVVGHMGAINRREYESFIGEMREIESYIEEESLGLAPPLPPSLQGEEDPQKRLAELKARAYSINDHVGKSGVEGKFEEELRGFRGLKIYDSDARGTFLRELPGGRPPLSGKQLVLTLSAELQEFAEELLAKNEAIREGRSCYKDSKTGVTHTLRQPWIKGGAIVAMEPQTGEVVALASYPRFDPNDFVPSRDPEKRREKQDKIHRWLETSHYLGQVWDQRCPLEREVGSAEGIQTEELWLTWERFLERILPEDHPIMGALVIRGRVVDGVQALQAFTRLLEITGDPRPISLINYLFPEEEGHLLHKDLGLSRKKRAQLELLLQQEAEEVQLLRLQLQRYLASLRHNYDKLLLLDLYQLAVPKFDLSEEMLGEVGEQPLSVYRQNGVSLERLRHLLKKGVKQQFHQREFAQWRQNHEKAFLKEKRLYEREVGTYQHPYLDYLDEEESRQFSAFWAEQGWQRVQQWITGEGEEEEKAALFALQDRVWSREEKETWNRDWARMSEELGGLPSPLITQYLEGVRSFSELTFPLFGHYPHLRKEKGAQYGYHLAASFYPVYGFGYSRSHGYRQGVAQGSIFKVVTGYAALIEAYEKALERGEEHVELSPFTMTDRLHRGDPKISKWNLGFFADGRPIPQYHEGGRLIRSVSRSIGEVDLPRAMEFSSNPYFSLLAGDCLEDPQDLARYAQMLSYGSRTGIDLTGEYGGKVPGDLASNRSGLYEFAIGQHTLVATPLQTAVMLSAMVNGGKVFRPLIVSEISGSCLDWEGGLSREEQLALRVPCDLRREIWMPLPVRRVLWEAMGRSAWRTQTVSRYNLYRHYGEAREGVDALVRLKGSLLGKSSTAEAREAVGLDLERGWNMYNHLWYGTAAFPHSFPLDEGGKVVWDQVEEPDLVVTVYLRFGGYGSEAAPLAAQVIEKWREIQERHR